MAYGNCKVQVNSLQLVDVLRVLKYDVDHKNKLEIVIFRGYYK